MLETSAPPLERPRRLHFDWLIPALIRPRRVFETVAHYAGGAWLTPLLLLSLMEIARGILAGNIAAAVVANQPPQLPPDFASLPPDIQEQILQSAQAQQAAMSNPLIHIVFPTALALLGVWIGWLLVASVLHLALTLLGGRSAMRNTLNVTAWAMLPFVVRSLVRVVFHLVTQSSINAAGLSGFAPEDNAFVQALLVFVDVYLIWHLILLVVGARYASGLSTGKVIGAVVVSLLIVLSLQALPGFIGAQISRLGSSTF